MSRVLTPDPGTLAADVVPNFEQKVASLAGEQRAHWELTGELPADTPNPDAADPAATPDLSPASEGSQEPESGAAPDPAIEEQSHVGESPSEKSERKKRNDYARYVREKTRADMLERQLAELKTAPAPVAKPADKPAQAEVPKERPKRPRFNDYDDGNLYDTAMDKYESDMDLWNGRVVEDRVSGVRQETQQTSERKERNARIAAAREQYTDYDKFAQAEVPVSYGMAEFLLSQEQGPSVQYLLGKTPAEAERIAKLTAFPGEDKFQTIGEFQKWIKADPDRAMLYGEKRAIAKAELAKLGKSNTAAQHRTPSRPGKPTSEVAVEARGAQAIDGLEDAIKTQNFEAYERIANQRDIAERTGRR